MAQAKGAQPKKDVNESPEDSKQVDESDVKRNVNESPEETAEKLAIQRATDIEAPKYRYTVAPGCSITVGKKLLPANSGIKDGLIGDKALQKLIKKAVVVDNG